MSDALIPAGDDHAERLTGERCFIRELLNDPRVPDVSLAEARVEPGTTTALHRLTVAEWYVVSSGRGLMQVGDETPFEVGPGDAVAIPVGVAQRIENRGDCDLVFSCVCLPRYTAQCYEALE